MICRVCGKKITEPKYAEPICSSECFHEDFWLTRYTALQKDSKAFAIINGSCYYYDRKKPIDNSPFSFKGFDGRLFRIRYPDGKEVETNNLWHNGKIPDNWRDRLPDNAEFIKPKG